MSSRNTNLTLENRKNAVCLHRALMSAQKLFESGERRSGEIRQKMIQILEPVKNSQVDYVSVAHPETLEELDLIEGSALISLAVFMGKVRLIDNITITTENLVNKGLAE
jgi:pantoate--beta-alanine ligase